MAEYLGYAGHGAALERRENLAQSVGRRDRKGRKKPQRAVSSMGTGSGPDILPLLLIIVMGPRSRVGSLG